MVRKGQRGWRPRSNGDHIKHGYTSCGCDRCKGWGMVRKEDARPAQLEDAKEYDNEADSVGEDQAEQQACAGSPGFTNP